MQTELINHTSLLFDALASNDTIALGEVFHQSLLKAAEKGYVVPNTLYVLTPTKLVVQELEGENATMRFEEATQFGRDATAEFGSQPLHYLVHQAMCFESSSKDLLPNADPNRTESCYTFITPLLDLCLADSMEAHMEILMNWDQRVWSHKLHEGLPIEAKYKGSLLVTTTNKEKERYDKTETNIAVIDNGIINNAIVGLSPSFQAVHTARNSTPLEQAISLERMKKHADRIYAETYAN